MCPCTVTCVNWCSSSLNRERCRAETENPNKAAGNWPWAAVLSQIALQHLKAAGIIRLACSTWPLSGTHRPQPGLYVSTIRCIPVTENWQRSPVVLRKVDLGLLNDASGFISAEIIQSWQRKATLGELRWSSADVSKLTLNPRLSFGCQYKIRIPIWIFRLF